jgi:hypothetical protein
MASSPVPPPLEQFEENGVYIVGDDTIGRTVKSVDDQGLASDKESWRQFADIVLGLEVRWKRPSLLQTDILTEQRDVVRS